MMGFFYKLWMCPNFCMDAPWGEKVNKNYTRILRAVLNKSWKQHSLKTAAVRPLTYSLTNHPRKTNKTCSTVLRKQGQTRNRRSLMDSDTWTHQCWSTNSVRMLDMVERTIFGLVWFYGISTIAGYLMAKSTFIRINSSISDNSF